MTFKSGACILLAGFLWGCRPDARKKAQVYVLPDGTVSADSLLLLSDSLERSSSAASGDKKAEARTVKGLYYVKLSRYRQGRHEFIQALAQVNGSPSSALSAKCYVGMGVASTNLGDYPDALQNYKHALRVYDRLGDTLGEAAAQASIGQVFQLKNDLPAAVTHLRTALGLLKNHHRSASYLVALHTLANTYGMNNDLDRALQLDEEGLALSDQMKQPEYASTFLDNKANCFLYSDRLDSARYYFLKSLAIDSAIGNKKQQSDTWLSLGVLSRMENDDKTAIDNFHRSIALATAVGYRNAQASAWSNLSEVYAENNDFKKAFAAQKEFFRWKDSLVNARSETAIAEWKAIYETEKKEKQIRLQAVQLREKNTIISAICGGAILVMLAAYATYRRRSVRREMAHREQLYERERQATMDVITAEEKERQRIAADLHDGVGQTMTAAWLNLQALIPVSAGLATSDAGLIRTTTELVGNSCAEIRQISHNMIPNVLFKQGLLRAVQTFMEQMDEHVLSVTVSSSDPVMLPDRTAELVLYRVIQECVNNVLKHAGATELDISFSREDDVLAVLVEDNGHGFDPLRSTPFEGIGMENIRSRIAYLRGTVEWSSSPGGTLVAIYIPAV